MPHFKVNPGRPYGISPTLLAILSYWLRLALKSSPSASLRSNGAISSLRECGLPYGLRASLSTLQILPSMRSISSVGSDTLASSWYLQDSVKVGGYSLSLQGLSPCQMMLSFLAHVTVGTRVAPCPPRSSRRAVFPHRALQRYSLPQSG